MTTRRAGWAVTLAGRLAAEAKEFCAASKVSAHGFTPALGLSLAHGSYREARAAVMGGSGYQSIGFSLPAHHTCAL